MSTPQLGRQVRTGILATNRQQNAAPTGRAGEGAFPAGASSATPSSQAKNSRQSTPRPRERQCSLGFFMRRTAPDARPHYHSRLPRTTMRSEDML